MTSKIWSRDWFAALAFTLVFAGLAFAVFSDSFQSLERYTYDLGVRARERVPSDRIAIVAIDDESIRNLGRWPWPRKQQAQLIDVLRKGGAKVIGNSVLFLEDEQNSGAEAINALARWLRQSELTQQIPAEIESFGLMLQDTARNAPEVAGVAQAYAASALSRQYKSEMAALLRQVDNAAASGAGGDIALAKAIQEHGKVILPMVFTIGRPQGRPDSDLPDYVQRSALKKIEDRVGARAGGALPLPTVSAQSPIANLGSVSGGIGHLNVTPDVDGAVRFEPLVLEYFDSFYPSLSLMVAAAALNLSPADIEVDLGQGIQLGGQRIGTSPALRMYTHFYTDDGETPAFPVDSAYDVLSGKLPASRYKDKIVLIGTTAVGTGDTFATPVSPSTAPVTTLAHTVSSLLQGDFYSRPSWAAWAELGVFAVLALYIALLLPRLPATAAAVVTLILAIGLIVTQVALMASMAMWLKLTVAAVFLLAGHAFMTVKKFNITERLKETSETEGAESNKMLGLAFQGQGQLDMAFDKFRRVKPVDDRLLDLIYNLALDFERKRQFNKAEAVYQYIAEHNASYRDIQQKLNRAKKLSETVILGGAGGHSHPGGTMMLDSDGTQKIEKPMLGRYQVEKELGKGAMGVVYMGKDPKIGRLVAIKTMALSQEFEPDELAGIKQRFFREAETAGRLTHPNIVSIFDAGEEHDLAYIAMEYIRGNDLTSHIKPNTLLPISEVVRLIAEAADALNYAHGNSVVHRDIKPANMMIVEATKTLKLMDFGIARITDSSKTKTGMVLGTPSYMSPEQLAGRRVDGRSDLFSLGVTLYQLLTGALPFQADSMVNLMLKITNEAPAPARVLRPDLPPALSAIIDRLLSKKADDRYANGADLARDLRALAINT